MREAGEVYRQCERGGHHHDRAAAGKNPAAPDLCGGRPGRSARHAPDLSRYFDAGASAGEGRGVVRGVRGVALSRRVGGVADPRSRHGRPAQPRGARVASSAPSTSTKASAATRRFPIQATIVLLTNAPRIPRARRAASSMRSAYPITRRSRRSIAGFSDNPFDFSHDDRNVTFEIGMSVIESILKDLQSLPTSKLVEIARYVHGLNEAAHEERRAVLKRTHGALSEEDGEAFEQALAGSRRVES